jgi:uncharacterized delta-60 repeat protein
VLIQPDGKIVAVGVSPNGSEVIRYNTDGSLDGSFGTGGRATANINEGDFATAAALQQNDKIVVVGEVSGSLTGGDNSDFGLVRFNSDGSPDTTFGNGGTVRTAIGNFNDAAVAVALQQDGKIVIAGTVLIGSGGDAQDFALARYIGDPVVVNNPPVAQADGPYLGVSGSPITLDASASTDPDGDALTYKWNFGDGTTLVTIPLSGGRNSLSLKVDGIRTDGHTATDRDQLVFIVQ